MPRSLTLLTILLLSWLLLAACQTVDDAPAMIVQVQVDNVGRSYQVPESMTVEEFLTEIGVEWDSDDRLVPPPFTQITDGTQITIVRVEQEEVCEEQEIPFEVEIVYNEAFAPDEERITQTGQNGVQRVCHRITYENGVAQESVQIGQPEIITEPIDEIRVVGVDEVVEPFPITGTLAYINNGNAWVITRTSTNKRPLTTTSDLDSLVLDISPDGRYLIFTREPADSQSFVNELWLIPTDGQSQAIQLTATNVLYAQWLQNQENTISYSTSEPQDIVPYWRALNNVFTERIDPTTGESLAVRQIVEESSGGLYGWWGTVYRWSPEGDTLAWVQADGMGIYDEAGLQEPLLQYTNFRNLQNWSWRANVSWSWDGSLLATTVHGPPLGNEPPDTSRVFNIVITNTSGDFEATIVEEAGMWSSPQFSPPIENPNSEYTTGYLAYLQARDPNNSVYGEYDLVVADRDGSNARIVFPPPNRAGITWADFGLTGLTPQGYTWSPDGRQIAVIYEGNLWVVDVLSGASHQLTFDGGSQHPVWTR